MRWNQHTAAQLLMVRSLWVNIYTKCSLWIECLLNSHGKSSILPGQVMYFWFCMFTGQVRLLILYLTGHVMTCSWFCICTGRVMSYSILYVDWSGQVMSYFILYVNWSGQVRSYFILHVDWSGQVMLLILHFDWLGQVICFWFCIATGQVGSYLVRSGHASDSVFYWPSLSYCRFCTLTGVYHVSDSAFWLIMSVIFLILYFDWSGLLYFWFCILTDQVCHISDSLFWLIRSVILLILYFDWWGHFHSGRQEWKVFSIWEQTQWLRLRIAQTQAPGVGLGLASSDTNETPKVCRLIFCCGSLRVPLYIANQCCFLFDVVLALLHVLPRWAVKVPVKTNLHNLCGCA